MNKRNLFLWSLYDFANSIVFINFLLYFAQWLVIDGGLSDFSYNAIFAVTTVLLLVSAPVIAGYVDRNGGRKFFLNTATIGTIISYGLAVTVASLGSGYVVLAALLFLVGQYFYQFSFVFYNAMIEDVASQEKRGRASGIGYFANALGQFFGLLLTFQFADSRLIPVGISIVAFSIFSLPMMLFFKESRVPRVAMSVKDLRESTQVFFRQLLSFFVVSASVPMLIAFFLFNDAILTLANNFAIVLERVFVVDDMQKSLVLMGIVVMSGIGGALSGWIADRIGFLKTLKLILVAWLVALPILAIVPESGSFIFFSIPIGLLIGSVFAVSRAYMSVLLSKDNMTYGFSFYTLAERFATFAGPLVWGTIVLLGSSSETSYRLAVAAMALFILAGLLILVFFRRENAVEFIPKRQG
ncbi:hypothetical protein A2673_01940 [Candidatus Kaiserbacteria bacterium RIFCSPHIGHO2_01_FULL_50_13]|uniref:Major facilitator superfamily (MFS) profile domain-containing protein n=1 Tax=Candidatus Kaiserbacteria bacterium RIFCSPLOWO2_01_FULL_50_24 TaxID=1798507 RepID=A0A1F6ER30_9BACT|nr:MAG: hypothetical protein A2673_01940 [Candidatus Kaiserbacteria bacterium RIFCSPHIGHO2_01_FULL_50_13]OGG76087.1 MAG: hypothetical protein A3A34_00605 [Candidatus Kaiserbacteria bacterium RIFCSPLOWO2_01_FULL_50_24]OGG81714.1 MAG: hypothetical protein A3H74_02905 [Candidatus Kaiserbacteria bacterium RIFCSPLOWO2_02_FULL_51_13]